MSSSSNKSLGKFLAIGGGMELSPTNPLIKKFIKLSGGESSRIIILPTASDFGSEIGPLYKEAFSGLCKEVDYFLIETREDAENEACLSYLKDATGVFFTGGNQLKITYLLGGTEFMNILRGKIEEGVIVAGTSAGASAMSSTMIAWGRADEMLKGSLQLSPGLSFIRNMVIDSHFIKRGRISRLLHMVAQHPGTLGIGLSEDTGILLDYEAEGSTFEVIGRRQIIVVDGRNIKHSNIASLTENKPYTVTDVKVHVLGPGYVYNFNSHKVIIPAQFEDLDVKETSDEVSELPYKPKIPTQDY
ncbi:MAG: cyanophycinase [Candidatus Heimdallarchaeota archaeon]|nr:cyanophycinase [Candidatus Heimdallarchaeota archaeon]